MKTRKYTWGNRSYEFFDPKPNRKRQLGLIGLVLSAPVADFTIPGTFGQITKYTWRFVKQNIGWMYK